MIKAARVAQKTSEANALELARRVLAIEAEAVRALTERLDGRFVAALELIAARHGRVVVSGIGKSGHIARKIASTMASTGTPADFVRTHPRGRLPHQALSRQALLHVKDVMRTGDQVSQVPSGATLREAVLEISRGRIGMTAVVEGGVVKGIFTDGDLRRTVERSGFDARSVDEVMTVAPKTVRPDMLAAQAVHMMEEFKVNQLLVVDERGALIGAL